MSMISLSAPAASLALLGLLLGGCDKKPGAGHAAASPASPSASASFSVRKLVEAQKTLPVPKMMGQETRVSSFRVLKGNDAIYPYDVEIEAYNSGHLLSDHGRGTWVFHIDEQGSASENYTKINSNYYEADSLWATKYFQSLMTAAKK